MNEAIQLKGRVTTVPHIERRRRRRRGITIDDLRVENIGNREDMITWLLKNSFRKIEDFWFRKAGGEFAVPGIGRVKVNPNSLFATIVPAT